MQYTTNTLIYVEGWELKKTSFLFKIIEFHDPPLLSTFWNEECWDDV